MEAITKTGKKLHGVIAAILVKKGAASPIEPELSAEELKAKQEEEARIKAEKKEAARLAKEKKAAEKKAKGEKPAKEKKAKK